MNSVQAVNIRLHTFIGKNLGSAECIDVIFYNDKYL